MTTALIVLAHPSCLSLSHTFADDVTRVFIAKGIPVETLDLYQDAFAPALSQTERQAYYTPTPNLAAIGKYTEQLSKADMLVLIFPTWWFGVPAIMKGWIDRVFAPTVAFDHANNFGPIRPRLTHLKSVLVITTVGGPWWIDWLIMHRPVRRVLKTAIFGLCAPQAKFQMLTLYSAEKVAAPKLANFRQKFTKVLA